MSYSELKERFKKKETPSVSTGESEGSYQKLKDRFKNAATKEKESKSPSQTLKDRFGGGSLSFADVGVDETYVNTFFTDASNFFKTAEDDYKKIGWGNASSSYDTRYQTSLDLSERAGYVRAYINANKGNLSEEQYNSFISFLDSYDKGSSDIITSFEGAKNFYAQFETEDDYNKWYTQEQDRNKKLSEKDVGEKLQHAEGYYNEAKGLWDQVSVAGEEQRHAYGMYRSTMSGGNIEEANKWLAIYKEKQALYEESKKQWNQKYGQLTFEDIESEYREKTTYYKEAEKLQTIEKFKTDAKGSEDFEQYAQVGADIENPTYDDVTWSWGGKLPSNIVTYVKDNFDSLTTADAYSGQAPNEKYHGKLIYNFLTDEETKIYNYYLGKGDAENAQKFLASIEDDLNERYAGFMYSTFDGDGVVERLTQIGVMFATGVDNYFEGWEGFGNQIAGNETITTPDASDYLSLKVSQDLHDSGWLGGFAADFALSLGNQLPSMLLRFVPVVGTAASFASVGISASGSAYQEMINLGYSKDQARAYGTMVGGSEVLLGVLLDGATNALVGKLGGGALSKGVTEFFVNKVDNAFAKTAIRLGGSMLSEFTEEAMQEILEPVFKSIVTGEKYDPASFGDVMYAGLMGAVTAGVIGSVSSQVNAYGKYQTGKAIKEAGAVDRLTALGSTFSADSVAYKLAGKVDGSTGAYKIGNLFYELGASLSEQNKADISNALTNKGVLPEDAKTISETLAEVVEGQPFTDNVAEILNNNDIVSKVFFEEIIQKNSTVMQRMQSYGEITNALNTGTAFDNTTVEAENGSQTAETAEVVNSSSEGQTVETATEKTSTEGKTLYKDEEVSVQKVESIKDGQVFVKLNNGKVVNAKEVDFATKDESLIYEAVTDMSVDTANAFLLGYDRGVLRADGKPLSVDQYIKGFKDAHKYGQYSFPETDLNKGVFTSVLREQQRKIAYERGKADYAASKSSTISKTENVDQNGNSVSSKTVKTKKGSVKFVKSLADTTLKTEQQKTGVAYAKVMAEAFGKNIYLYASKVENGARVFIDPLDGKIKDAPNGFYDKKTGNIYIDINAGNKGEGVILFTLAHELTHDIRRQSEKAFRAFAEVVMEAYGKSGESVHQLVLNQIANAKAEGRTITFDQAYEEVVADSAEKMLADSESIKKISEKIKVKDKSLWERIKKWFTDLIAKLTGAYERFDPQSVEGRIIGGMVDDFSKIQDAWINALFEANENSQSNKSLNTESVSMSEDGNVMLQMRQYRETGRSVLRNYLVSQYGETDADNLISTIDSIYNTMAEIKGENEALSVFGNWQETTIELDENGHPIFTTSIKNGDYELNQDFSRVCKKRRQLDFVLNMLAEDPAFEASHLTKQDFVKINQAIKEHGFEIACSLCFVDAKRFRQAEWADSFANTWNDILNAVVKDSSKLTPFNFATKNPNIADEGIEINTNNPVMYRKWSEGKEDVKGRRNYDSLEQLLSDDGNANVKTIARLIRDNPELRHTFRGADIIGSQGFDTMQRLAPAIRSILDGWGGSSVPKPSSNDASYDSSIINLQSYNKEKAKAMGGARMNSFSDFMAHMFFDYCQAFADLSAKELPSQAYTKELYYVRFFGRSGQKQNMSGIPAIRENALSLTGKGADANKEIEKRWAGLDVSRLLEHLNKEAKDLTAQEVEQFLDMVDYVWADESIDMKKAILLQTGILYDKLSDSKIEECYELLKEGEVQEALKVAGEENVDREYAKHCGTIVVGVSDAHIRKLLRDPTIRMVIPYHKSGLNPIVARELRISAYNDYTDVQNTGAILKGTTTRNGLTSKAISGYGLKDFSFYDWFGKTIDGKLYDGKATADKYIEWCEKGYYDETVGDYVYYTTKGEGYILAKDLHKKLKIVPKFDAFMAEENYYKVLEDFDCYNTITGEHSAQGAVDFLRKGLPSDYKQILVDALKAEQKTSDDFRDHLDNKGLKNKIMGIVQKNGYNPSENTSSSDDSNIMYSSRGKAPTFYSQMSKVVEGMKQDKFAATSVIPMLRGRGVKAEEIRWSGIATWLEGKKSVTKQELLEFINSSMLQIGEQMSDDIDNTKWSQYKLDGGSNYRELVFTMPNSTYTNRAMKTHWGQDAEGILVHARIQDFVVDGKKMLFIEEIQSDWHNEGHSKGYSTKEYEDAVDSHDKLYNEYKKLDLAFHKYVRSNEFMTDPDDVRKKKHDWLRRKVDTAQKKYLDAEKVVNSLKEKGMGDTPDAPFKENYHEFVLKRLLRMASEEGYDSIGWTPAEIQSKRWSEDYAEGYRIEYDQEIPKFLRKYGRQWGAKVEKTKSPNGEEIWSMDLTDSMKDTVVNEGQVMYSARNNKSNEFNPDGKTLREQLEDAYSTSESFDQRYVYVGKFTENFRNLLKDNEIVINDYPIAMNYRDAYLSMHSKETGKYHGDNINYHNLGVDGLESALESFKSPLNIIKSKKDGKIELVLQGVDKKGQSLLSIVSINTVTLNGKKFLDAHVVTSVYGKRNIDRYVHKAEEEGRLIRIKKDETSQGIPQVQYKGNINDISSNNSISENPDVVNQNTENSQNSSRNQDSISNRSLLANALESAAQNDIERNKLAQYKEKIDLINSEEAKLHDLREQIKTLSFAKGRKDTATINKLQAEATQTANRINTYDRQLLTLESTSALKKVLEREKRMAYKRAEQRGKEALAEYKERADKKMEALKEKHQESWQKSIERRSKTEMRHKIREEVKSLDTLLRNPTKEKHIPMHFQKPVAELLSLINMDTINAEERIANINKQLAEEKDIDKIEELINKRNYIQARGDSVGARLKDLQNAYGEIINSDNPYLENTLPAEIYDHISSLILEVGDTPLIKMSLDQLDCVNKVVTAVHHAIREANKSFKFAKDVAISTHASNTMAEFDALKKKGGYDKGKLKPLLEKLATKELTPYDFFDILGSTTLAKAFDEVRKGEEIAATDAYEATQFAQKTKKKYGYDSKEWKKHDAEQQKKFTADNGKEFYLNLEQKMSLYAYYRRVQAQPHLGIGGIVFPEGTEVQVEENGKEVTRLTRNADRHPLSEDTIKQIIDTLSPNQKSFVEEMQAYLSDVMGAKGNEVSRAMYGIEIFGEKIYFPLKSAEAYSQKAEESNARAKQGDVKIKNKGMTKATKPNANNPIIIEGFMDVWSNHINEMSVYHGLTLPLEDFTRIFNYKTPNGTELETVKQYIINAYGKAGVDYINRLLKDINGGVFSDSAAGIVNKMVSGFKKAKTFTSLSVVIQQFSSLPRAFAYIEPQYFFGKKVSKQKRSETYEEMKKYAPVVIIKEIGGFDANSGRGIVDYIKSNKYEGKEKLKPSNLWEKRDDILSALPAWADRVVWMRIWEAAKRKVKANNPKMDVNSDAFLKEVGNVFTETITRTQVYDSVFAKNEYMRSKDTGMKMVTAFGAEPAKVVGMITNAVVQAKRGNKKFAAKVFGSVMASTVLNAVLVSLVYAMRDDDEDETYAEKYAESLTAEFLEGFNPLTYLPLIKDIYSLFQGYDIERTDMALWADISDSIKNLALVLSKDTDSMSDDQLMEHNKDVNDSIWGIIDSVSAITGIPVGNIRRDVNGAINTIKTLIKDFSGRQTSAGSLWDSIADSAKDSTPIVGWLPDDTKADKLYEAIMSGDTVYADRLKNSYKTEDAYNTAIRKALRENDSRIREAAQARMKGSRDYSRILNEIVAEGNFDAETVEGAINSEISDIKKEEAEKNGTVKPDDGKEEVTSIYSASDINLAFNNGDKTYAKEIIAELIDVKMANGKTEKEAKSSIRSSMTSYWKPLYKEAYKNDSAEASRIRRILFDSGLYGGANDVIYTTRNWLKED